MKTYIDKYRDNLADDITLDILINQNIEKTLVDCIDVNAFNNDRKSAYLHKSKIHLLNCIVFLFLLSVSFTFNYINHEKEEIHKVQLININDMPNDERTPPPPPPRQEPRIIKEDKQPTRHTPPPNPRPKSN